MQRLLDNLVSLLVLLSGFVAIVTGLVGIALLLLGLGGGTGGFVLHGLGATEGLFVLGAGNLACLVLHALILATGRPPGKGDGLRRFAVRVQLPLAIVFVLAVAGALLLDRHGDSVRQRAQAITAGLAAGDPAALDALRDCTGGCLAHLSADRQLLLAAQHGRPDLARLAIQRGGRIPDPMMGVEQLDRPIACAGGITLPYANALDIAVVRDDAALFDLILPRTHVAPRDHALYTAAILGRHALLKRLMAHASLTALPPNIWPAYIAGPRTPLVVPDTPVACEPTSPMPPGAAP